MISKSDTPINLGYVKAHIVVFGNESADAIAKHAALHNYGHNEAFPQASPDGTGNHFSHVYWLAEEENETTHKKLLTSTNLEISNSFSQILDGSTKSGLAGTCSQQDIPQWLLPNLSADEL